MKNVNLFLSGVVCLLLVGLMNVDWAGLGELILKSVGIGVAVTFLIAWVISICEPTKNTEGSSLRPDYSKPNHY